MFDINILLLPVDSVCLWAVVVYGSAHNHLGIAAEIGRRYSLHEVMNLILPARRPCSMQEETQNALLPLVIFYKCGLSWLKIGAKVGITCRMLVC